MELASGYLISYLKYGDSDAILHCFLREKGYQSLFLRGAYSPKSKKRAYLFPLNELSITITGKKLGSMTNISKIELMNTAVFSNDVKVNAILFFVVNFLNQILRNENSSEAIYLEIGRFLESLKSENYSSHLTFLFNLLKIQGISPLISDGNFLNPQSGAFELAVSHQFFDREISSVWKEVLKNKMPYQVFIPGNQRKRVINSLLMYYQFHYPDFHTPNSLEIVQQIFE